MGLLEAREIVEFRSCYYGLHSRLWIREPDADLLAALKRDSSAKEGAAGSLDPLLEKGWEEVDRALEEEEPEAIVDAFTRLFIGPMVPQVQPYESFYLAGQVYREPLSEVRTFLDRLGLRKDDGLAEPEDMLAFELEVMRWLVGKQWEAKGPEVERWLDLQKEFLGDHLLVWAPRCACEVEEASPSRFYRGLATLLRGFLEVEKRLFRERGLENVISLEEARRRYGKGPAWRGPVFDLPEGGEPPLGKKQ
jgi:TorA maturation chaperone TorD